MAGATRKMMIGAFLASIILTFEPAAARQPVNIALTFDDLPAHGPLPPGETRLSVAKAILAALKAHHVREAYGFVTGGFGAGDPESAQVLAAWRTADQPLGNHSWSHANLDTVDTDAYTADITRNEGVIASRMDRRDWHWYRYPYLAEGVEPVRRAKVRAFLAGRGYHVASVTLNFDDWAYNEPYARCVSKGDTAAISQLEQRWLGAARESLKQSRAATRPGTPLVALLHVGAFTAHMLPALLTQWKSQDARYVRLAQAEQHRLYAGDARSVASGSPVRLATGLPSPDLTGLCRS
jgi:peptidoglycan-N-acetylglucosamine deacetylase